MASDLLMIAASGTRAARVALDVTAQNIANSATEGYVRRSARMSEVASAGGFKRFGDLSVSGVRISGVVRNVDPFRQAEVRRTGADAARANAEVAGLEKIEAAVEVSGVYPAIVRFETALQRLSTSPVDPSLRASMLMDARSMVDTFNLASRELDGVRDELQLSAEDGVSKANRLIEELALSNVRIGRAAESPNDKTALLDQRDRLLEDLSSHSALSTKFAADGTVELRLGSGSGPLILQGETIGTIGVSTAPDGSLSFLVDGVATAMTGGSLTGYGLALTKLADTRGRLDSVANTMAAAVNAGQTHGAALDGSPGQPMFTGNGAGELALALTDGSQISTAILGSPPNSGNTGGLVALRSSLADAAPAKAMNAVLFDISSAVASRTVTRDALKTIAGTARDALDRQAGVDLDQEAVNLVRYQQMFQASGRAIQIASDMLDSLLAIR